jgi:hypothetical protein
MALVSATAQAVVAVQAAHDLVLRRRDRVLPVPV